MNGWRASLVPWTWSVLAAAPFLAVYALHYTCAVPEATGFIGYDQPYYVANGRAIFERGNGLAYPNPFDPDPASPVVYFHLFIWPLGFAVVRLGVDPGVAFVAFGVAGALVASRLTWSLVAACVSDNIVALQAGVSRTQNAWHARLACRFLVVMWGGGLFAAAAIASNLASGQPLLFRPMRFDPVDGWWFLNWGRNLVYAMEAAYHALMAACWLGVLRRRWVVAAAAAGILAASHPFSGFQCLLILGAWCVAGQLRRTDRPPAWLCIVVAVMLTLFLGYNVHYLGQFASHRALVDRWSLPWLLDARAAFLAYAPVLALALIPAALAAAARWNTRADRLGAGPSPDSWSSRAWRVVRELDPRWQFLSVACAVSFLLSKHDWFVAPRQPLHFTRGYVWLPLCLIGLAGAARLATWLASCGLAGRFALAAAAALAVLDNTVWISEYALRCGEFGMFLSSGERAVLWRIERARHAGVIASGDARLDYLAAVYTSARPYAGHLTNTPDWAARRRQIDSLYAPGTPGEWVDAIDLLLIRTADRNRFPGWREVDSAGDWIVVARQGGPPDQ